MYVAVVEMRRGQEPPSDKIHGVTLICPPDSRIAIIILDTTHDDLESSWNKVVDEAWDSGFRGQILLEEPDVIHDHYQLYLLIA